MHVHRWRAARDRGGADEAIALTLGTGWNTLLFRVGRADDRLHLGLSDDPTAR
jgi:hypothetical protein